MLASSEASARLPQKPLSIRDRRDEAELSDLAAASLQETLTAVANAASQTVGWPELDAGDLPKIPAQKSMRYFTDAPIGNLN